MQVGEAYLHYAAQAVGPATLATYRSALTQWRDYCDEEELPADVGTTSPVQAANFFAWLADSESLAATTIKGYASAMRHHWTTANGYRLSADSSPFSTDLSRVTIRGIQRALAPADQAARQDPAVTAPMGPQQLARLKDHFQPSAAIDGVRAQATDERVMLWAAATVASYGLLRPNEFLGSYRHVDRALRPSQLTFFARAGGTTQALPGQYEGVPQRVQLTLGATKADQLGTNAPIVIDARLCVEAIWRWMHRRLAFSGEVQAGPVFRLPGQRPLSIRTLLDALTAALRVVDPHIVHHLTGRCFRRGGASALVQAGASTSDIMQAGRWRSPAMVRTYAEPGVMRAREEAAAAGVQSSLQPAPIRPRSAFGSSA